MTICNTHYIISYLISPFNGFHGAAHFGIIPLKTITELFQSVPAEKRL